MNNKKKTVQIDALKFIRFHLLSSKTDIVLDYSTSFTDHTRRPSHHQSAFGYTIQI